MRVSSQLQWDIFYASICLSPMPSQRHAYKAMQQPTNKPDQAKPIELAVWKDPQCFVITEHVRDLARLYFRCWKSPGVDAPYIGCLSFEGVWHLDCSRHKALKGYPDVAENDLVSYYLIVENSSLLQRLCSERTLHTPDWEHFDRSAYSHWIVESHDFYTNIVAASVAFSKITGEGAQRCFDIWEAV